MMLSSITSIAENFELILYKTQADLRTEARRYYISYLLWIVEPVLEMIVFFIVFGLFRESAIENFVPFLLIGLTVWKWFATAVKHGAQSIMNSRATIHQVNLPKVIYPVIDILSDTFKFFIIFSVLLVFLFFYGFEITINYMYLPFVIFTHFLLIAALGFLLAGLVPFLPDLKILVETFLRFGMLISGIFFSGEKITPAYQSWFYLNPMASIIESYRDILMYASPPLFRALSIISLVSLCLIVACCQLIMYFDKLYPRLTNQ